jgi:hypothetical protein
MQLGLWVLPRERRTREEEDGVGGGVGWARVGGIFLIFHK